MKILIRILILLVCCVSVLMALKISTELPNEKRNGFKRNWISGILPEKEISKLETPVNEFSGFSNESFYLTGMNPSAILVVDKNLKVKDTIIVNLNISPENMVPNKVEIDSPNIYIHLNNLKEIIFGRLHQKLNKTTINTEVFTKSAQISDSSLIIRVVDPSLKKQSICKIASKTGKVLSKTDLITNQTDGGISSDGMLVFEKQNSKLFYIQYFNNSIYCLDTNLNLLYKSHTIDTTSLQQFEMKYEEENGSGKGKLVPSNARKVVNKKCIISRNLLLISSGLRADNEDLSSFNRNSVIDAYHLSDGKYIGSFYLPKIKEGQYKNAIIVNDEIVALYDKKLIKFNLPTILQQH